MTNKKAKWRKIEPRVVTFQTTIPNSHYYALLENVESPMNFTDFYKAHTKKFNGGPCIRKIFSENKTIHRLASFATYEMFQIDKAKPNRKLDHTLLILDSDAIETPATTYEAFFSEGDLVYLGGSTDKMPAIFYHNKDLSIIFQEQFSQHIQPFRRFRESCNTLPKKYQEAIRSILKGK